MKRKYVSAPHGSMRAPVPTPVSIPSEETKPYPGMSRPVKSM